MNRRDLLRLLLGSAIAEAVDVERLLWVPKPIVTVPDIARWFDVPLKLVWPLDSYRPSLDTACVFMEDNAAVFGGRVIYISTRWSA